jgi:NAD-dependent dihydropyrimidine dehydrogenase PreA subunit
MIVLVARAREMVDGNHTYNPDLCFGCGLCASTSPTNAIKIIDR